MLRKIQDELKSRNVELHVAEDSKKKLASEKSFLEERLLRLEKKSSDEVRPGNFLNFGESMIV